MLSFSNRLASIVHCIPNIWLQSTSCDIVLSKRSVFIAGAGIAGPVCVYLLPGAGIYTTTIERAPELRHAGQQIDIRGSGLTVVQRMGLEEAILSKATKEKRLASMDPKGNRRAEFPVDEKGGMSFTSDIEIRREILVKIFYDGGKESTERIFGVIIILL